MRPPHPQPARTSHCIMNSPAPPPTPSLPPSLLPLLISGLAKSSVIDPLVQDLSGVVGPTEDVPWVVGIYVPFFSFPDLRRRAAACCAQHLGPGAASQSRGLVGGRAESMRSLTPRR